MCSLPRFHDALWTVGNEDRAFPEWHGDEPCYYFWTIMVDQQDWVDNARQAGHWLAPYLLNDYQRQPHVTILPAGFPAATALPVSVICEIAREIQAFHLDLGALGSFTSAACFEVLDQQDMLRQLRRRLRRVMVDPASVVNDVDYQPHLTVGLYSGQFSTARVCRQMERYTMSPSGPLAVRSFMLARYATSSIKGPIETVAEFEFGSGKFTIHQTSQLLP